MILETADLHLNDQPRDSYRHTLMAKTLPELIRQHRATTLIICGDLADEKDHHGAWLVNQIVSHMKALCRQVSDIIILRGNHDYTDPQSPYFQFLSSLPKITWINTPTEMSLFGDRVLFLPHTANYKRDWKGLDFRGFKRIYAHQTFQGADTGPRKLEGIPPSVISPTLPIYSGDIHPPQTFDNVTYIGAPYRINFGDDYEPRVLIRSNKEVKSVPVPGVQKRLVEVETFDALHGATSMLNKGDIVKVRFVLKSSDHAEWPMIKKTVQLWAEDNGFQLHLVQPRIEQSGKATARRRTVARTDEQLMERYAQARAVNKTTLETGLKLMRQS